MSIPRWPGRAFFIKNIRCRILWFRVLISAALIATAIGMASEMSSLRSSQQRLIEVNRQLEEDLAFLRAQYIEQLKALRELDCLRYGGCGFANSWLEGPPVPAITGQVTAIKSDIEPPLLLLDVGSCDRAEKGFAFTVFRDDTFIGKAVVERVEDNQAACRLLFVAEGAEVKVGDQVATRLP